MDIDKVYIGLTYLSYRLSFILLQLLCSHFMHLVQCIELHAPHACRINLPWNSLKLPGKVYSACMSSNMLHGSETWPTERENKIALQWAEMSMMWSGCVGLTLRAELSLCDIRTEIRNSSRTYCGAAKQIKMIWTRLKEGWWRLSEKIQNFWGWGAKRRKLGRGWG